MLIPGLAVVYVKYSNIIWINVGLQEWIPYQFVAWYLNIDDELVGPLIGFDGNDDISMARLSIYGLVRDFV